MEVDLWLKTLDDYLFNDRAGEDANGAWDGVRKYIQELESAVLSYDAFQLQPLTRDIAARRDVVDCERNVGATTDPP
jgi:hypothetical protein